MAVNLTTKRVAAITQRTGRYRPARLESVILHGYHGRSEWAEGDVHWLTTDRDHAGVFGEVTKVTYRGTDVLILDAERDVRLRRLSGARADAALRRILQRSRARAVAMIGWEGDGVVLLSREAIRQ